MRQRMGFWASLYELIGKQGGDLWVFSKSQGENGSLKQAISITQKGSGITVTITIFQSHRAQVNVNTFCLLSPTQTTSYGSFWMMLLSHFPSPFQADSYSWFNNRYQQYLFWESIPNHLPNAIKQSQYVFSL